MMNLSGLQLPYEPMVKVYGVNPINCFVFKSAIAPMCLNFKIKNFSGLEEGVTQPNDTTMQGIYKNGDDIRQDQVVLQLFRVMDFLLKEKGEIDLKFTLYKVLATSNDDGFMEFV